MEEELATYKLQLQQVEAALLGDPDNTELHKLKEDLTEIISLQVADWKIQKNIFFQHIFWQQINF